MDSVRDILETQDVGEISDMDVNEFYTVDSGSDAMMDLTVEKTYSDTVMVAHLYEQRGDIIADPELRFDASEWSDWTPTEFRQDGAPQVHQQDSTGLGQGVQDFVSQWDDNLRRQGYVERARNGYID